MDCPTCHSHIGTGTSRIQGEEGVDADGNPVPRWSDDPILTVLGINGEDYQGEDRLRKLQVVELQTIRADQEEELGISPTPFSDVTTDVHVIRRHIIELRESTEKILNVVGVTLEDYFKLDPDGNEVPQNPELALRGVADPQVEWTDVERGEDYIHVDASIDGTFTLPDSSTQESPTVPTGTHVRAIHIEDLRHPIQLGVPALLVDALGPLYGLPTISAKKFGPVTFKGATKCGE